MILAGEKFASAHNFRFTDADLKQQDPVHAPRIGIPVNDALQTGFVGLIRL